MQAGISRALPLRGSVYLLVIHCSSSPHWYASVSWFLFVILCRCWSVILLCKRCIL